MNGARKIVESRAGKIVVTAIAAIAVGTAITAGVAPGVFNSPPPACYVTAPAAGATLTGASTLAAKCGASSASIEFLLDGSVVIGQDGASPFSVSWNSNAAQNGSHTVSALICDSSGTNCSTTGTVSVTTSNSATAPVNVGLPVVSGSINVGNVLTAGPGTWSGDTSSGFTYQWRDGSGNISGATSSTYTIGAGENGLLIHVTVTATGTGGSASADSTTVGPITNTGVSVARLWVVPSGGSSTCTRDSSAVSYATAVTDGAVCNNFQTAYTKAVTGDTILVGCGGAASCTYGDQTFATNNSGLTNYVTFAPAAGVAPQFGCYTTLANDGSIYHHADATINVADTSCWSGATPAYSVNMNVGETTPSFCTTIASGTQFTGCVGGTGTIGTGNQFTYPETVYRPGKISVQGVNWVKFDGLNIIEMGVGSAANHVTFTNGRMLAWSIGGQSNDINVTYTHIGPFQNGRANAGPHGNSTNITFDHDVIDSINAAGDVTPGTFTNYHGESFYIGYGDNLTISNSIFTNYAEYAIFISPGQEAQHGTQVWMFDHVHIVNNFFGPANTKFSSDAAIQNYNGNVAGFSPNLGIENWTVEYNTFDYPGTTAWTNYPGGMHNVVVRGNYGLKGWSASCGAANTWDDNVWSTTGCTGDASSAALSFVNAAIGDLHLLAGAGAIGQGDPLSFPATDIDGGTRSSPPDAGADQFGAP